MHTGFGPMTGRGLNQIDARPCPGSPRLGSVHTVTVRTANAWTADATVAFAYDEMNPRSGLRIVHRG